MTAAHVNAERQPWEGFDQLCTPHPASPAYVFQQTINWHQRRPGRNAHRASWVAVFV